MPASPANADRTCSVAGCTRPLSARGYCHGHVQRLYRLGDVVPEVPLGGASIVAASRQAGRDAQGEGR